MITTLAISGYRSIADLTLAPGRLCVITGGNGSGKSNLYQALRLMASIAEGRVIGEIAAEGGLDSVLWAGPQQPAGPGSQGTMRTKPVSLLLGVATDELGYLIDLGLPRPDHTSLFGRDPEIKREQLFAGPHARPSTLFVDRLRSSVRIRDITWRRLEQDLDSEQSVLTELIESGVGAELMAVCRMMRSWRFYDYFRTDRDAPARQPRVGTRSRLLSHEGENLAAVWQSIVEAGGGAALDLAVDRAFPGARVSVAVEAGIFRLLVRPPGLLRPLEAAELSAGTLRYLLLCAALLPVHPAPLIVLNEPEASLHPELIGPLGELITAASERGQAIVVTHSSRLADALSDAGAARVELENAGYGTTIVGQGLLDAPPWNWGKR